MFIEQYFSEPNGNLCFTREQGSDFAKRIADDFNPLHDVDARRFCIPGDLLFSVILSKYGISQHMECIFSGMVAAGTELILPAPTTQLQINDAQDRQYLRVDRSGENSQDTDIIEKLAREYVEFSGHSFPHILVPLLAQHKVMINPARPMVMYQSMSIDLDRLDISAPSLLSDHSELEISGQRGNALLVFKVLDAGEVIGRGKKQILLSGLREYDRDIMEQQVTNYDERKRDFFAQADSALG